jgi:hypothetical protein
MRLRARLHRAFPEKRLFLKSDTETRFVRIGTGTQIVALGGGTLLVGWTILASSILLMNALGAGNLREQSARQQEIYETRLNALAEARDDRAEEARLAHERFAKALAEVSQMQTRLLASENSRRELEQGIEVIQATLRRTVDERDTARGESALLLAKLVAAIPRRAAAGCTKARFRGAHGTPIHATADGVVIHAGWQGGYGGSSRSATTSGSRRAMRICPTFACARGKGSRAETGSVIWGILAARPAPISTTRCGSAARPVNPMTYIKAARDVF